MASPVWLRLSVALCALLALAALGGGDALAADGVSRSLTDQMIATVLPIAPPATDVSLKDTSLDDTAALSRDISSANTVLYLRVSRDYLSKRFEKSVDRTKPLVDLILGTRIRGKSHTEGNTRLVLVPSADSFQAEIEFVGTVHSKSRGENGPAILQLESDSTFRATKRITLDNQGLSAAPAHADAKTRAHTRGIQSRSGGLMGEVVKRIARRRVAQSRSQADAIASDHTAKIVATDLDRGVEKAFAKLSQAFATAAGLDDVDLKTLTAHRAGQTLHIQLRTTADYAELAMSPQPATWEQLAASLPQVDAQPHVALRVHRSMMSHVATGSSKSTPPIARMLLATLQSRLVAPPTIKTVDANSPASLSEPATQLSIGIDWLAIDVHPPVQSEFAVHAAKETAPALVETAR
jgi:hypothetical protein